MTRKKHSIFTEKKCLSNQTSSWGEPLPIKENPLVVKPDILFVALVSDTQWRRRAWSRGDILLSLGENTFLNLTNMEQGIITLSKFDFESFSQLKGMIDSIVLRERGQENDEG